MRPGYLGELDDRWFGSITAGEAVKYLDVPHIAQPPEKVVGYVPEHLLYAPNKTYLPNSLDLMFH